MTEQRTDAELRAQFPYHGETLECVAIRTNYKGYKASYTFTVDRRAITGNHDKASKLAKFDQMTINGDVDTIKLFTGLGVQYNLKDPYALLDLSKAPIEVIVHHDTKRNMPRIQAVTYNGKTLKLKEESPAQHEAPKQENVGTPYILPDSTSAKLAQLVALAESVLEDMPDYAIAAQIVQHARILQGLELSGKPEQLAEIPKKKRR